MLHSQLQISCRPILRSPDGKETLHVAVLPGAQRGGRFTNSDILAHSSLASRSAILDASAQLPALLYPPNALSTTFSVPIPQLFLPGFHPELKFIEQYWGCADSPPPLSRKDLKPWRECRPPDLQVSSHWTEFHFSSRAGNICLSSPPG